MPFQNDYHHMLDVLNNRRPARLPVYEHIISPLIMEKILGYAVCRPDQRPVRSTRNSFSASIAAFSRR